MNDHSRGCEGREYTCTCGYDAQQEARIAKLEAENKFARDALEMISRVAGNLPDDILCSATGANDARYRGGLVCTARDIARAALEAKP